jgi:enamine deaminase RidA (YjgF/YER057c/UK114 family)
MAPQHVNPEGVSKPNYYSHVVTSDSGKVAFISGQIALDAAGNVVGAGDLAKQGEQVFENLKACLESVGATFNDVLKFTTYVVNYKPEDRAVIGALRQKYLTPENAPASTLVGVQALATPDFLIEIECVAALP